MAQTRGPLSTGKAPPTPLHQQGNAVPPQLLTTAEQLYGYAQEGTFAAAW